MPTRDSINSTRPGAFRKPPAGRTCGGKFYDLHVAHKSPVAEEALERIGELYAIEKEIRGRPAEERRQVRDDAAAALAGVAEAVARRDVGQAVEKIGHGAGGALRARALGSAAALRGRRPLEIDNNAAERALRAVALGRKNYLFAGSDAGGERAAAIYSLIGTAKLNGLDPEATCATCCPASPTIRLTASRNCCPGTSPQAYSSKCNTWREQRRHREGLYRHYLSYIAELIKDGEITIGVLDPSGASRQRATQTALWLCSFGGRARPWSNY